jgi:acyl dehydratase
LASRATSAIPIEYPGAAKPQALSSEDIVDLIARFAETARIVDKLRVPAPLPIGERVRMRVALDAVDPIPSGAALSLTLTFERAAGGKPVCVANAIYRVYE